jgi:hypothetical protein
MLGSIAARRRQERGQRIELGEPQPVSLYDIPVFINGGIVDFLVLVLEFREVDPPGRGVFRLPERPVRREPEPPDVAPARDSSR